MSFTPYSWHLTRSGTNELFRDLSTRLGLGQDEGEKWIVNLIRDTRVDAKIDYKEGTVIMNHPPQSVYQQVIEKTKGAFFRTQVLRYVTLISMHTYKEIRSDHGIVRRLRNKTTISKSDDSMVH